MGTDHVRFDDEFTAPSVARVTTMVRFTFDGDEPVPTDPAGILNVKTIDELVPTPLPEL